MSFNPNPIYLGNCRSGQATLTAASTQRSGTPTNPQTAFVADTVTGGLVETLRLLNTGPIGTAPTAVNVIRMWRLGSNGTTYTLIEEFTTTASTPSATLAGASSATSGPAAPGTAGTIQNNSPAILRNVKLGPGEGLAFSIHTYGSAGDQWTIDVTGGDYKTA